MSLALPRACAEHLGELADVLGSTESRVAEVLIEREYAARHRVLDAESPWEVTDRAIDDALAILGARDFDRERMRDMLEAACVDADTAEREKRRAPRPRRDGRLQYRGPKPHRLTLIVETSVSGKRSLVGVTRSG